MKVQISMREDINGEIDVPGIIVLTEVEKDELSKAFFTSGWDSALDEVDMAWKNGGSESLINFIAIQRDQRARRAYEATATEAEPIPARRVDGPGEEVTEPATDAPQGQWLLPQDELDSMLDREYQRGRSEASKEADGKSTLSRSDVISAMFNLDDSNLVSRAEVEKALRLLDLLGVLVDER